MFKCEDFDIKLDTDYIGRNFIYCDEIESTNSELMETAQFNAHGTVMLAENQTRGKGRKNRTWLSAPLKNLTFSILLNEKLNKLKAGTIGYAVSLATAITLENLYQLKIDLKWPNDVLVNAKKICGILLDSSSKGDKIEKIVVGVGLNVNQAIFSGQFRIPPTSIRKEFGNEVSRERTLSEFLNNFEDLYNRLLKNPEDIISDWKERCRSLGEKIIIEDENIEKFGVFENIDEEGFLLLKTNNGIEKISFGEVGVK